MPSDDWQAEALKISIQARNLEIELLWRRSIFFWGFIASAFAAYVTSRPSHPFVALAAACFGMVCSFAWTLINRGSKFWQENWESKVRQHEPPVIGLMFATVEPPKTRKGFWLCARPFSPSKLIIALSDYVCAIWLAIVVGEVVREVVPARSWQSIAVGGAKALAVLSFIYVILLLVFCQRSEDDILRAQSSQSSAGHG